MTVGDDPMLAFDLTGRVAVVTGAASGIGRETAIVLAQAGARLVVADIDGDGLDDTAAMVAQAGGAVIARIADLSHRADMDALANAALDWGGRLDGWVNAAGVLRSFAILDATEADLDRLLRVNVQGTYWGCAAAGRAMRPQRRGAIVNISSAAADNPLPMLSAYALGKAGINMLTRTAAHEFGAFGCRVNAVAPGFIDTPMGSEAYRDANGRVDAGLRDAFLSARAAATPLAAVGHPRDVALAVLYLISDASRFVTGQILRPNGGVVMP